MNRSHGSSRRVLALLAGLSLMATAACGSTAQTAGQTVLSGGQGTGQVADGFVSDAVAEDGLGGGEPGGGELGSDGLTRADGAFGSSDGASSSAAGSARGVVGSGGSSGSGAGGSAQGPASGGGTASGAGSASGVAHGPGVTDTSIHLGIPYCSDCGSANAALGAGGEDYGDPRRYYQVAIDDVNARGGVLGRKLVPVWHEISASQNIDASSQAMCETFFKDNKVLLVFMRGEIVYECAKKAGAIVSGGDASGPVFDRYPNMFAPATIRHERLGAVTVKAMVKAGWHKPEPRWPTGRIGLITWDNNDYRYSMDKGWLPALKESGLSATDVRYIAVPQSDKSLADASAAISSAGCPSARRASTTSSSRTAQPASSPGPA